MNAFSSLAASLVGRAAIVPIGVPTELAGANGRAFDWGGGVSACWNELDEAGAGCAWSCVGEAPVGGELLLGND
jgi:hypothetical protein